MFMRHFAGDVYRCYVEQCDDRALFFHQHPGCNLIDYLCRKVHGKRSIHELDRKSEVWQEGDVVI